MAWYKAEVKPADDLNDGRFKRRLAFIVSEDDCWIWASSCYKRLQPNGTVYKIPTFKIILEGSRINVNVYARRWAWERKFGLIQKGLDIVNVCGNSTCVKPDPKHNKPMKHGDWMKGV